MNVNYVELILSVIKDIRVILTIVAALFIIEFAGFVTSYRKKAPKPKKAKAAKAAPAPAAPAPAEGGEGGSGGDAGAAAPEQG